MKAVRLACALLFLAAAAPAADEAPPRAAYAPDGVPVAPDDPAWQEASAFRLALQPQNIAPPNGGGSVSAVSVRALHDGQRLALRFEWNDGTADREVGVDVFRDALAVGFPSTEGERLPSPFMGDAEHPINIWQWTADLDANEKGQGELAERYPHTEGVWYFPQDDAVTREVKAWRGARPVVELTASGFGTLERKSSQNVSATSMRDGDRWQVVLRRALSTGNPGDTLFRAGGTTHLISAVWNGSFEEVNGRKSVTLSWTPLELEPTFQAKKEDADGAGKATEQAAADAEPAEDGAGD